jgi:hypothetical protein
VIVYSPQLLGGFVLAPASGGQRCAHQAEHLCAQFPKLYRRIKVKAWRQVPRAG